MRASASRARAPLARVARGQLETFVHGRGRSRTLARGVASEDGRADAMTREGKIVSEETLHSRYVTVYDRVVELYGVLYNLLLVNYFQVSFQKKVV